MFCRFPFKQLSFRHIFLKLLCFKLGRIFHLSILQQAEQKKKRSQCIIQVMHVQYRNMLGQDPVVPLYNSWLLCIYLRTQLFFFFFFPPVFSACLLYRIVSRKYIIFKLSRLYCESSWHDFLEERCTTLTNLKKSVLNTRQLPWLSYIVTCGFLAQNKTATTTHIHKVYIFLRKFLRKENKLWK